MAFQLVNELCCIKNYSGVYEQNSIVNSGRVDVWTTELAIITSLIMEVRSIHYVAWNKNKNPSRLVDKSLMSPITTIVIEKSSRNPHEIARLNLLFFEKVRQ